MSSPRSANLLLHILRLGWIRETGSHCYSRPLDLSCCWRPSLWLNSCHPPFGSPPAAAAYRWATHHCVDQRVERLDLWRNGRDLGGFWCFAWEGKGRGEDDGLTHVASVLLMQKKNIIFKSSMEDFLMKFILWFVNFTLQCVLHNGIPLDHLFSCLSHPFLDLLNYHYFTAAASMKYSKPSTHTLFLLVW